MLAVTTSTHLMIDDNVSLILYVGSRMTGSHQIQKVARVGTRVTYVQPLLSTVETGNLKF